MKPPLPDDEGTNVEHPTPNAVLLVRLSAILTGVLGLLVLSGWAFDLSLLRSVLPGAVEMKANTAVGLVLGGWALFILSDRPSRLSPWAQVLAVAVAALGLATLSQYLFGWHLGIDELLFRDTSVAYNAIPGRMSPYSAAAFAGIGTALALLPHPPLQPLARVAATAVTTIGALSLLGYLWNASELVTDHFLPPVAFNTAVAFVMLGAGTLVAARKPVAPGGRERMAVTAVETKVLASFLAALLLMVIGGGFTYRNTAALAESAQSISQSRQVRRALSDLYGAIADFESAQRNYLITGQRAQLDEFTSLVASSADKQQILARLLADNPAQRQNFAELERLVDRVIDLLGRGIALYQQRGFPAARELVASGQSFEVMRAILALTRRMDAIQESLLADREAALVRIRQRTFVSLLLTVLVATSLFVLLYRGIRREMVARNEAEKSLVKRTAEVVAANRFLDSVIENIPDTVFVKDAADLRYVRLNRAGEELIGYSRDELLGKNDHDLFQKEEAELFMSKDRIVLKGGLVEDFPEEPITLRGKGVRLLHTKKIPIFDEHQRPLYLLGISEDVTEKKEKEREILLLNAALEHRTTEVEAANKELESFSYSVSHDLRAPLRHINGYVEMLAGEKESTLSPEARRYLQVIADSSQQMGQLIDDLLEFSRMGRAELRETRVDLNELIRDTITQLDPEMRDRRIGWTIPALPPAKGDRAMLKQVLINLLGNAVKYSRRRDPAQIEIGLAGEEGGRLIYFVRDNGAGFDMKYAHKLFGVFQRLHREEDFEGTGVGLANVRRIIARHGGRVWAEAAPDQGATFYFTLTPAA